MKTFRGFAAGLLVGCVLMFAVPTFAAAVKQYMLTEVTYPLYVNDTVYESTEHPILNYQGHTYLPMRAMGDVLGVPVTWNEALKQAQVRTENVAFRNIVAAGRDGDYTIKGQARVFEATMNYAVSDGHSYLLEGFHNLNEGAPEWSAFTLDIEIPQDQLPVNGTLTIEIFEYSAKDGSKVNTVIVPLESFGG